MRTPSGQMTAPPVQALLKDANLAGEWVLDPGLTWNQIGMTSMHSTLTIHAVFTRR